MQIQSHVAWRIHESLPALRNFDDKNLQIPNLMNAKCQPKQFESEMIKQCRVLACLGDCIA